MTRFFLPLCVGVLKKEYKGSLEWKVVRLLLQVFVSGVILSGILLSNSFITRLVYLCSLDLHISSLCEKIPFEEKQAWEEIKCVPSPSLQITIMALYYCTALDNYYGFCFTTSVQI